MNDEIKISKSFTVGDWKSLRTKLLNTEEKWPDALDVFENRIYARFISPIETIKSNGINEGEGFTIALISVVLLEFIAAFELGKIYKPTKEGLSPNKYFSGIRLLRSFIKDSILFSKHLGSNSKIDKFYKNIRCGLVHEARTMKNDVIISENSRKNTKTNLFYFTENNETRLNRDLLLTTINEHIIFYKSRILKKDIILRNRFLIKMDEISGLKHSWYFIYGSNLCEEQLKKRLHELDEIYLQKERCFLEGYEFLYDKKSIDGSSKGNIKKSINVTVQGIVILILENKLDEFIDKWEPGYEKEEIEVQSKLDNGKLLKFKAYTCKSNKISSAPPTKEYVAKIIKGAKENEISKEYINEFFIYSD